MFGLFKKKKADTGLQLHFDAAKLGTEVARVKSAGVQSMPNAVAGLNPAEYTGVMQVFNSEGAVVNVTDIVPANDQRLKTGELGADTYVDTIQGRPVIVRDKYGRSLV